MSAAYTVDLLHALVEATGYDPDDFGADPGDPSALCVEQDGDCPGWRLEVGDGCFSLTREVGWYVQSVEGKTPAELRLLVKAMDAADLALSQVLDA